MPRRQRPLRRLDLLVLGAKPEKLAQHTEIPAVQGPALHHDQSERLYILNYRRQFDRRPLTTEEQLERDRLMRKLGGAK